MAENKIKTISTTNDFAILVYPWKTPYLDENMEEGEPYLLRLGPHFCSFTRNKDIGGTLQIEAFGANLPGEIGDWIVFKTSSAKNISEDFKTALKEGTTKFIGQIYSRNITHVADGDGNIRSYTQYTIREWSHVFHITVKLDVLAAASNSRSPGGSRREETVSLAAKATGKDPSEIINELNSSRFNPFNFTVALLKIIGAISASDERVREFSNLYQVSTRLPLIPEKLVQDNILTYRPPVGAWPAFDKKNPWATGFFWSILGVQKWKEGKNIYTEVFKDISSFWENLKLSFDRPYSLNDPLMYTTDYSFIQSLRQQFGDAGVYEMYTDILYFQNSKRCAPALVVRDTPMSFRKLYEKAPEDIKNQFSWTFFDDIPRINVSSASVISITFSSSASESANFIRLNYVPGSFRDTSGHAESTVNGVFTNVPSQKKFGSVFETKIITAFLSEQEQQPLENKSESQTESKSHSSISRNWFESLATRIGNYTPNLFLFPKANVYIKDNDYPISVGMAIRIEFKHLKLVGFVEAVNCMYKVEPDGKRKNDYYIDLSNCCMENSDGLLQPIPKQIMAGLSKYVPDPSHEKAALEAWKFYKKDEI